MLGDKFLGANTRISHKSLNGLKPKTYLFKELKMHVENSHKRLKNTHQSLRKTFYSFSSSAALATSLTGLPGA